jgi:membrane associated rhomboid family serine protease
MLIKSLDRLERKFGKFAIRGLMIYITTGNLAVFILDYLMPSLNLPLKLMLIPSLVLKGEVWRLITYIFIPPNTNIIFILFVIYFYYMIGSTLEHEWGSFKLTVYYLLGMIGTTIAAFFTGGSSSTYLNLSLFLAFAYLFPDFEILIFFILPVKIKYLAWLNWAFIVFTIVFGDIRLKIAAIVQVANFFLFFGSDLLKWIKSRRNVYYNRKNFFRQIEEGRKANKQNRR